MKDQIVFRQITTASPEYESLLDLRDEELRRPLGMNLRAEDLSDDRKDIIIIAISGEQLAGCVMLHPVDEHTTKLRQMAVTAALHGKGIGKMLVLKAEKAAAEAGFQKIILHARITAREFYAKLGYAPRGELFTEVSIPHVLMEKDLF